MKQINAVFILICMLATMILLTSCAVSGDSFVDDSMSAAPDNGVGYLPDADFDGTYVPDADIDDSYLLGKGELSAPSKGGAYASGESDSYLPGADMGEGESTDDTVSNVPDEGIVLPAGMITAGAWNDNIYYNDWIALFSQEEETCGKFFSYTNPDNSWGYNSLDRVNVRVNNEDGPVAGASVVAYDNQDNVVFSAITDAEGNAYLFPNLKEGNIRVTSGTENVNASFTANDRYITVELAEKGNKLNVIELMLVVDVTGSMSDEIDFLKAELADVVNRIAENDSETVIKLAMLFYRDTDDKVPFDYYDFTDVTTPEGLIKQQSELNKQGASGGGDYPEAVDEALNIAVNKQWSTGSTTKIIFHVLDAPAHSGQKYKEKLKNSIKTAAEKGIRICPIICSGASDDTEYTMREAAIYTGGTFIFVTDDSGIGNGHHDPGLPNATVELLNSMMVRLVKGYHTGEFEDPIYWKQDPNLGTNE